MLIEGEFYYRNGVLACEEADLSKVAAEHGTPCYVYSQQAITSRFAEYKNALKDIPSRVCFAVKANSNLAVLSLLARAGAGFDIVSGGELYRVLLAGADAASVVFSGVGKTEEEIQFALEKGIHSFNCESEWELKEISRLALSLGRTASVALRVNPDVNALTHPYISTGLREHKFGIDMSEAERIYVGAQSLGGIRIEGVSCHIGSQLLESGPLLEAADKVINLAERLRARGIPIRFLDLGGGIGVRYRPTDQIISVGDFISHLRSKVNSLGLTLMLEPGRSIVGEAGALLCRVILIKQNGAKTFVVVDAGMNDLIRPSLYGAHHEIIPVHQTNNEKKIEADIVGPVCETGDFFAHGRPITEVKTGDLLAIQTAGAYGFVLSSNYNSRPRACEVLVNGKQARVIRRRESYEDLIRGECTLS